MHYDLLDDIDEWRKPPTEQELQIQRMAAESQHRMHMAEIRHYKELERLRADCARRSHERAQELREQRRWMLIIGCITIAACYGTCSIIYHMATTLPHYEELVKH